MEIPESVCNLEISIHEINDYLIKINVAIDYGALRGRNRKREFKPKIVGQSDPDYIDNTLYVCSYI